MKRVAILGGSFNPMHIGHAEMIEEARRVLAPDELWLMPAKKPPHKAAYEYAGDEHRVNMLKAYASDFDDVFVDETELHMDGFTYTANTLKLLKDRHTDINFIFLMGADSAKNFHNWYKPEVIVENAELGLFSRNDIGKEELEELADSLKSKFGGVYHIIDFKPADISSTMIRSLAGEGKDIKGLVPEKVREYIEKAGLYSKEPETGYDKEFLISEMEKALKPSRFKHSLGVMETAKELAMIYGADPQKAEIAGILHDCAKNLGPDKLRNLCCQNNIPVSEREKTDDNVADALLHSKVGALLAKNLYNVDDKEILDAIYYHTVGRPEMPLLEKVIYLADFIEPSRTQNCKPGLDVIRKLAKTDIDRAVYYATKATVDYVTEKGRYLNPESLETLKYYSRYKGEF